MKFKIIFLSSLIFIAGTNSASAHSTLIASNPKNGSTIALLPKKIWLEFNENLLTITGKSINRLSLTGPHGIYSIGKVIVSGSKVLVAVKDSSDKGLFTINWRVVSEDGHPVSGSAKFKVS